MPPKKDTKGEALTITRLKRGRATFCILGTSPLMYNRVSQKAQRELLYPKGKKTAAERQGTLKHEPRQEFRDSMYKFLDKDHSSLLYFPVGGFKKAMMTAALEVPGTKKAQIGRLVWIADHDVEIFGLPLLKMDIVRMADIARTPDVRTRACLAEWAAKLTIEFVMPTLNTTQVANLLDAAGMIVGIGDGRQEKGSMNFGQFEIVDEDNPEFQRLINNCGYAAQAEAVNDPVLWPDPEAEELLSWFDKEVVVRGHTSKTLDGGKEKPLIETDDDDDDDTFEATGAEAAA